MDMTKINKLINLYERRLVALRSLKGLLEDDPELAAEAFSMLASHTSPGARNRPPRLRRATQRDKLMDYLKDGEWRTVREMSVGVGADRASIAPHLYRESELFETRKHPEEPRLRQWRLKSQAIQTKGAVQ